MSDTPRTDAEPTYKTGIAQTRTVNIDFARQFERELAEAKEQLRLCNVDNFATAAELADAVAKEQKPVGQLQESAYGRGGVLWFNKPADQSMLYTAPPRREWVGLTQTQVKLLREGVHEESIKTGDSIDWVFYTHINEALKEKNSE